MKVEKTLEENLKREFNITVPANDIEVEVTAKLQKIGEGRTIPGFRPGKAPIKILKQKYGKDVLGEVLESVVSKSTNQALNDNDLTPAYQPKIEITEFEEGKDLKYKVSLEILPEIPEIKYSDIKITKYEIEVDDESIKKVQEDIAQNQKTFAPKGDGKKAEKGDAVNMDFKGFTDGEAFAGGEAQGHQLELGSNSFIPGFEEQLIGTKKGDEVKVEVKFPEQYHSADLAGKDALFEVKINDVLVNAESKFDDELVKTLGFETVEKFNEVIVDQLAKDGESMARVLTKKELFDVLDKQVTVDLPENLIEQESAAIINQIKQSAAQSGEKLDKSDDDLKEEYSDLAERRVKLGLLVTEISKKSNLQVSQDELNKAVIDEARKFPGQEQQVYEFFQKNPQQIQALRGPILEEKVVDEIIEKSEPKVAKKKLSEIRDMVQKLDEADEGDEKKSSAKKKPAAKKSTAKKEDSSEKKPAAKKKTSAAKKKSEDK